jgi:hypothetical protein
VKAAIEHLLRQKFSCDSITVQSADEYHCNQHDKVIFLKANVSTLFAKDRVDRFYYYLNTEKVLIFNDTVEVSQEDPLDAATPSDPMVYLYVLIAAVVVFCIIVFFIIATVLLIRKRSFK